MEKMEENKPASRIPLQVGVIFRKSYGRKEILGVLRNLSLSGAFLKLTNCAEYTVEDKLLLTVNVSGRQRKLAASVIWKNSDGCGIKFNPFNNRDLQIVDDLMYFVESSRSSRKSVLDNIFKQTA